MIYKKTMIFIGAASIFGQVSFADTITTSGTDTTLETIFTRNQGSAYTTSTNRIHFLSDVFNFYKYYEDQHQERESFRFYMKPPFSASFIKIDAQGQKDQLFPATFRYVDISSLSSALKEHPKTGLTSYASFLQRTLLTNDQMNNPYTPSDFFSFPRLSTQALFNVTDDPDRNELKRAGSYDGLMYNHFYLYCNESDSDTCKSILENVSRGTTLSNSPDNYNNPNGDINAESLLAVNSFSAASNTNRAARDYVQNITDPFPKLIVPKNQDTSSSSTFTPDMTPKTIAKNIVDKSYRSLSQYVLNEIKNRRVKQSSSDSMSELEYLESMSKERLMNSNEWIAALSSTSTEGLLRELALIESTRLWMDYIKFRQQEHIEALLAASIAQNQNLLDMLNFTTPDTSAALEAFK